MRHVCNVVLLASVVEVVGIESGICVVVMLDDDVTSVSFWGNTVEKKQSSTEKKPCQTCV